MGAHLSFTIHEHLADKAGLHQDLRLELPNGGVRSWAVPKGVPETYGTKRLAIEGPLHTQADLTFEGEIIESYGKGTLSIIDTGSYSLNIVKEDKLNFELHGDKYDGKYTLVRYNTGRANNWLLIKH